MPFDLQKFTKLYDHLFKIDFTGGVAGMIPPLSTVANVRAATSRGAPFLPLVYRQNFLEPLDAALPYVMSRLQQEVQTGEKSKELMMAILESLYGPVYQQGTKVTAVDNRAQLRRLLAVVSNLFRSFVNSNKRLSAGVRLVDETPPLAMFQSGSLPGPFTIETDLMRSHFGTSIGIVSLPAAYRDHPVLWASLTHEVCGHDVVHADADLVPELVAAVRSMLAPNFAPRKELNTATLNALIWSYWMDEAVADVYGVLNMGPIFPINLAAYLSAFRAKLQVDLGGLPRPTQPVLSTTVGPRDPAHGDSNMDDHPVDILRLYLATGVIDGLSKLDAAKRAEYIASVEAVARATAGGATEISLEGRVEISHDNWMPIKATMKLSEATDAARQVGNMIATGRFKALNGHCIQDIETWDDADEETAEVIAGQILKKESIVGRGDDAQLLAGTTLALLRQPDLYDIAGSLLNAALDDSYRNDPIWGPLTADHFLAPNAFQQPQSKSKPAARKGGKSSSKASARRGKR